MAVSTLFLVMPSAGKRRSNHDLYSPILGSSRRRSSNFMFISPGAVIGPSAWASSVGARPSQNSGAPHAVLRTDGACRPTFSFAAPTGRSTGTSYPKDGLWQLAQLIFFAPERRGSKKSFFPSVASCGEYGALVGKGIAVGRRY